jgi:hypothetical protein
MIYIENIGDERMLEIADGLDEAHALLVAVLEEKHQERSRKHFADIESG